ncbi:hypothetical protein DFS34DRAFT_574203 [Phlyctochytrium arcticum]|nr:hypothetical protein DFS34DRAFT_574203 [Phlyctochytrium arcticum]
MPSIGLSWVYFAVLSLRLYIPRVPNDPAAIPGIKLRFSEQKTAALEAELFVRRMCEQAFTGNKENQITQRLAIEMQAWQRKSAKWRKHVAYRPEDSQITALFNDLHQLVYQVANIQTLEKIFEVDPRSGNVEPISFEQERAMQGTLESFVDRMEVKYPLYQDLLHPVKLAVYQLKFGLRLWRDQIESSQLASRQIERKLVNWAATFMDTDPQGSKVFSPKMLDTESRFDVNLRVELLATFLERICSIAGLRGKSRLSDIGGAHEVLSAIVDAWTFTEKKRLEDERIAQEFYIHKEQKHEVQSEDEIDRHRFQDIFPDYADDYTSDNVVTEGTGETEKPNISEVSSIVGEDTFGESVVNYHQQLLYSWTEGMAKPDEFPASWSSAFKRSYSGAASLIRTFGDDKMKMTTMDVGSHAFMASVQENALTSSRNDDTSLYDFYADSNILEVRQILPLLNRLMTRLHQLLEQWPGQEVLLQLAAINHRILGFAITSPVMKFLTGLELLLQRSNDWEAYASKEASLKESLTEITESIVKWRKLEISCWRELLDVEERRKHRAACKLWFQMWNLLMTLVTREYSSQPDDDSDSQKLYNELITNLDQFLITSPSGEFSSRLRMLESFYRHLTVMLQLSEGHQLYTMQHVRKILFHTHKYYQILEKGITETISKSRKPIWKELNDYVKIATWKDVNVFALKESAKKSHYHLHKFVKKYRAILEVPVQTLLQSAVVMGNISGREQKHLAKSSRQQARTTQAVVLPPGNGLQDLLQISGAKHFTNIPDFMVKMSQHMKVFESPDLQDSTSAILEDLVDTILSSVEEFQSETANTSDRTSKSAQGAKAIRRKALVDLLKRLRDLGLSFYSANKYKAQESPSYLFTLPVPLESPSTQTLELWQRCDHYFYTLLRRMTELRQTRHGASADLSRVEIERATSVIEHLWHINIADHRDIVSDKFKSIMAIQKDSVDEVAIAFSQAVLLVETLGPHYTHLQRLRVALTECKAAVLTWKSTLDQQCEEYLNCSNPIAPRQQEVVLSLAKSVLVLSQCDEKLSSACTQDSQSTRNELFAGIVRNLELTVRKNKCHLDAALGMNEEITTALQEATTDSEYLDTVLQKADTLVKSVLLAFQDIVNEAELQLVSPESEQAILFSRSVRSRFLQSQRFGHVVKSLTSLLTLMDTSKASAERRVWVQIIGCLRPVVMQFSIALQARLEDSIRDHKSLLKTNYVLCNTFSELFKKGFCLPNEEAPTEDDGQEAPAVDGMGIGEGDGEKDVSDEIENQGQVEGMQDEKPADNTGQKLEDQPEGLEMDDDFDGQLEDLDLDPGSDDGQDEAEQENQLEDQMGDLDDSADVLDERLWGDEEKDHGENGKDDKMELDGNAGKSSSEIEMVANDVVSEDAPAPDPAKKAQENADKPTDPNENDDGEDAKHTEDNEVNEKDELEEHHNVDPKDAGKPQPVDDDDSADMDDDQSDEIKDRDDQDAALEFEEKNDPAESNLPPTNEETPGKDEEFGSDFEDNDMENAPAPDEVEDMSLDDEHALDDGEPEMAEDGENEETPEETPRGDEVEEASSLNALDKTEATNEDDADNSEDQTNPINEPLQDQQDSSAIAGDAGAANDTSDNQDQEGTTDGVAQQLQETAADNEGGQDVAPTQTGGDDQNDDSNKTPKGKNAGEMNPHRSLGDALQKWMSRINELESRVNQEDTPRPQEDNSSTSKNKNFEFVQNDQDAADAQALGDATAKQLAETDQAALADRDQEADYEHQDPASDSEQDDSMDPETPTEAAEVRVQEASKQKYNGRSEENPESASAGATNHAEDLAVAEENIIPLSTVQYDTMRHELEQWLAEWRRSGQDPAESQKLWQSYAALTRDLSFTLCEQLRLILEPTLATKLKGDYRTGKRLNMRKIVPYIASQFKKDKIWMRRTKPSKRSYQILLSIDDSRSMVESESVQLAFESLATITKALTQLESGDVGVISFGEDVKLLHPFDRPFTDESGADVLRRFSFAQERTNVLGMIRTAMDILSEAKMTSPMGGDDLWQLQLVISDGICEDHEQIRSVVRKAAEERIMVVFIILDNRGEKDSIVKMTNVTYDTDASSGRMMLQMNRYMDTFPFDYYVVVGNVAGLPEVLSDVLRQFFLFVNS